MESSNPPTISCHYCQAENRGGSTSCASCGRSLVRRGGTEETPIPPVGREESARRTVHLNTVMLLIAVIAVCLGVLREVPGLGILLIILVIPAMARTLIGAARRQARGRAMSWHEKMLAFIGSLGIVTVIGLAATIAFVATCFPAGVVMASAGGGIGFIVAVLAGLAAAGYVFYLLGRTLWPQKDS